MKPAVNYNRFVELKEQGRVGRGRELIETHVFDMPDRIRQTFGDPNWFVCRNTDECVWEIHYDGKAFDTLEITVPVPELDDRVIGLIRRNRAADARRIMQEIVASNAKMVSDKNNARHEYAGAVIGDAIDYMKHHPTKDLKMDEVKASMTDAERL